MDFKLAIFDLDGVVTNTVPIHYAAWKRLFESQGLTFTFRTYLDKVDGLPRLQGVKNMLPDKGPEELEKLAAEKQAYYLEFLDSMPLEVFDDTLNLMASIKSNGVPVCVASSSKNTPLILEKIGLTGLATVVTGNDFKESKPSPEIFLTAAGRVGIEPENCVVFEDALAGVQAAIAGGMRSIGVCRGDKATEELGVADISVKTLDEIDFEILKRLFKKE